MIKTSVRLPWVLYACNIYHCHSKLPVFVHSSQRVLRFLLADLDQLNYWCLTNCIYRDLALQITIKTDLTQMLRCSASC